MAKLSKKIVDSTPIPKDGQTKVWDSELRGFGLRVLPSGLKTFVLQYRNAEGRSRMLTLGRYGVFTVEQCRELAKIRLGEIAGGNDPMADRAKARDGMTVSEICDWYLEMAESGRILGRKRRPIKQSTLRMDRSRIETHIKPLLGRRKVEALRLPDIEQMQTDIAAGRTSKGIGRGRGRVTTGGTGAASRSVSTFHSLLSHAVRVGLIEKNPAAGVRRLAGEKRERRLSVDEIERFGMVMREAEADGEHPVGIAAARLILMTGFRLNEAAMLQRDRLNVDGGYVDFADTKSDAQTRAIGEAAVDLILDQPIIEKCPHVFPSDSGRGHFTATDGVIGRLCKRAGIEGVTAHTLRHTFASVAGDLGFSEVTIGALLGHATRSVTQRYIHVDEALRLAAERVSQKIADLLDGVDQSKVERRALPATGDRGHGRSLPNARREYRPQPPA